MLNLDEHILHNEQDHHVLTLMMNKATNFQQIQDPLREVLQEVLLLLFYDSLIQLLHFHELKKHFVELVFWQVYNNQKVVQQVHHVNTLEE